MELQQKAIELLKKLIVTPSFSGEEDETAKHICNWFDDHKIPFNCNDNNVWATNKHFDKNKPTILLNSHHDTVKPNSGYTNDPFEAKVKDGKLYGLGSNDAGGCLVSLIALFTHFHTSENLKYNLLMAATAEEESSGPNGLNSLLKIIPPIEFAVVGEPTQMNLAIAEKGLLVIDAYAPGVSGHAAHTNTDNAIYNAMDDIQWIRHYSFSKVSEVLGPVKMSATQINAGSQHNVVPASCHFVIDVRVNEHYSNQEVFEIINDHTKSELKARSFRLNSSSIPENHPIVQAGIALGRTTYGSPTLSDQASLSCPSLKLGPGDSTRSHQANEFIYLNEIEEGIDIYIKLFETIL
ncbi:M20 family metallo-hydrolase [Owenweeksia hongkongensis]|uniref:M20 family metallo-hydrolase n=1 Tax=Owenweeksia hongkongensis TaxID=253245 RepID=UPI003A8EE303